MTDTVKRIIEILDLKPLAVEGGYYRETYRSDETIVKLHLPHRYPSARTFSTAIYYLLTPETFSTLHKLPTDEIFHFYLGDPVEMLQLKDDGTGKLIIIGNDLERGCFPQVVVPKFVWQGTRLIEGGEFALLGATNAPGFEYEDFIVPDVEELIKQYPAYEKKIRQLIV
jgi:predicted cupin superfamily sugar epimerase